MNITTNLIGFEFLMCEPKILYSLVKTNTKFKNMIRLILMASMLLYTGVTNAQVKKCNGNILKLKNGTIEKYDASGVNKQSSIISNVKDFDCNDNEIAVVKTDGSVVFYTTGGNTKFSCGRGAIRIQYLDSKYYVVTKEDGTMRKYEVGGCNDRGTP